MRLLLLEDDLLLGEGLRDYMRAEQHVVEWCPTLAAARALQDEPFDALLVDWQLPDGSGLEWVRARRAAGDARPVLLLTARDLVSDRVRGLDAGADDYLVKPFAPEELQARLRAVARRSAAPAGARLRAGAAEVDREARAARLDGRQVDLTAREWTLLEALARRAGRIVTKGELDRLVLGLDAEVQSNALEVHVSSLRRKLGRDAIETVRGLGYRLPIAAAATGHP
jgi:two-component system OmpR family response regulator